MPHRAQERACRGFAKVAAGAALCAAATLVAVPGAGAAKPATTAGQQGGDRPVGSAAVAPNTTIKLIEILIQNGVLTRAQADALLKQAEAEAAAASQGPAAATRPPAGAGAGAGGAAAAGAAPSVIQAPSVPAGTVRVPYVPETVKKQIKEEVREEVVQQAKEEGWAQADSVPEWVKRIRLSGDIRGRYEHAFQDSNNFDQLPDFNDINDGDGLDLTFVDPAPLINTTEDRDRYRLRARLGVDAQIDDWVSASVRLATGNDDNPVSTNQTLGQDGNFSKYNIWLDRAFIQFTPDEAISGTIGRMPNPFWTTDLLFDDDLNFDGAAIQTSYPVDQQTALFFNAGGFPVFNTAFNFPETSSDKVKSRDKYLFAGQLGAEHKLNPEYKLKGAAGFFYFDNINGKTSSPCLLVSSDSSCDTDESRPQFVQKGNTMFGIRDLLDGPELLQYYGLAADFGVLDLYGRFDISTWDPLHLIFEANYVNNVLFDHGQINRKSPENNREGSAGDGSWEGGNQGFLIRATAGDERIDELWDWNVSLAYKYLESDAVVDAFTDSDFHLGGTNAKGYILGGNLGIAKNTFLSLRWLSAEEVSGPPLSIDVVQLDLSTRF